MNKSKFLVICIMSALMVSMVSCGTDESGSDVATSTSSSASSEANESSEAESEETTSDAESETNADESEAEESKAETSAAVVISDESSESEKTKTELAASEDATEEDFVPEENSTGFEAGVWEGPDCLYYFDEDGVSGRTSSYKTKTGVAFTYELNEDGTAVFHMGAADNNTYATVQFEDSSMYRYSPTAFILWDDDTETRLNYYLEGSEYDFDNFCDDNELVEMVKEFHKKETGDEPSNAEVSGEEGVYVPIDVYVDGELAAFYSVNRFSLYVANMEDGEYRKKLTD